MIFLYIEFWTNFLFDLHRFVLIILFYIYCYSFIEWAMQVKSQISNGTSQYHRCSSHTECTCFHMEGSIDISIFNFEWITCSYPVVYERRKNYGFKSIHVYVRHPWCHNLHVYYLLSKPDQQIYLLLSMWMLENEDKILNFFYRTYSQFEKEIKNWCFISIWWNLILYKIYQSVFKANAFYR